MWPFRKDSNLFKNLSSVQAFIMGAGWGIALTSTIILLVFMIIVLGTNQITPKTEDSSGLVAVKNNNVNQPTQPVPTQPQAPQGDFSKIPPLSSDEAVRGDKSAKLTLIEYSDYQCPFCGRLEPTLDKILQDYKGKVRLVYRNFPLNTIHPYAQKAAEAAECAGAQGKFWQMHDKLFENQTALSVDDLKKYAKEVGVSSSQFNDCLDSGSTASKVNKQAQDAQNGGITGTPAVFVGNQLVKGAVPYENFKSIIDSQLK